MNKQFTKGFTLMELLVTVSIIAILSSVLFATYNDAREQARDKLRMTDLKEMQVAIELYKAQNDQYPVSGCGASNSEFVGPGPVSTGGFEGYCDVYIVGLTPDFIDTLARDTKSESEDNSGFYYRSDGKSYKLMVKDSVETLTVDSYSHEFSRCPKQGGACSATTPPANTYAVYSKGAENW